MWWHHRSRDESLIAVTNEQCEEGRLSSVPAPTSGLDPPGVCGHGVNRVGVDGTFHREGTGALGPASPGRGCATGCGTGTGA